MLFFFFFFKQKTAYEMRISDWSSDVCSSDLPAGGGTPVPALDPLKKIGPPTPTLGEKSPLKDYLRALRQRRSRLVRVLRKIATRNLDYPVARVFQLLQMGGLMGIALFLKQRGILGIFPGSERLAAHIGKVERCRMKSEEHT